MQRIGGTIGFKVGGVAQKAKGEFTYGYGTPKRTGVAGTDGTVHGYTSEAQVPYFEGVITRLPGVNYKEWFMSEGDTVSLELASGETLMLYDAWNASDGTGTTGANEIPVRFEGVKMEQV